MPRTEKRLVKRVSGQEGYRERESYRLSKDGWGGLYNYFSIKRFTDGDGDEQVYWCITSGISTVCLNEHEAVALRELLPTHVVGGMIESVEEDW